MNFYLLTEEVLDKRPYDLHLVKTKALRNGSKKHLNVGQVESADDISQKNLVNSFI